MEESVKRALDLEYKNSIKQFVVHFDTEYQRQQIQLKNLRNELERFERSLDGLKRELNSLDGTMRNFSFDTSKAIDSFHSVMDSVDPKSLELVKKIVEMLNDH